MALVNHAKREINAKIVFCGPESAGKATLLKAIFNRLPENDRGQLRSMSFQQDMMLFFDFTHPDGGDPDKYSLRLHIYTLTGPVTQESAWKMVLKGVDGVAFVADSGAARLNANQQAFNNMQSALHANGKKLSDIPAIVICSKQDLPGAIGADQLFAAISLPSLPVFTLDNSDGANVLEPISEILDRLLTDLEGLGLELQSSARGLCRLAPGRTAKISGQIPSESLISVKTSHHAPPESELGEPSITLDGTPELTDDGTLSVGIKVNCCGKSTFSSLKISICNLV